MTDEDAREISAKLDNLTAMVSAQYTELCRDVGMLKTMAAEHDRQITRIFGLTDWIPRLQGAVALLVVLVPVILWLVGQRG